jgi:hypothetical protein
MYTPQPLSWEQNLHRRMARSREAKTRFRVKCRRVRVRNEAISAFVQRCSAQMGHSKYILQLRLFFLENDLYTRTR